MAKSGKVLVMNDNQEILELFENILTEEGYEVSLHSYSTRELSIVKKLAPTLIIVDQPPTLEKEGWQFLQKLKMDRETSDIPIVLCTTSVKLAMENEGFLNSKGIKVVLKPFDIDDLLEAIDQLLETAKAEKPTKKEEK